MPSCTASGGKKHTPGERRVPYTPKASTTHSTHEMLDGRACSEATLRRASVSPCACDASNHLCAREGVRACVRCRLDGWPCAPPVLSSTPEHAGSISEPARVVLGPSLPMQAETRSNVVARKVLVLKEIIKQRRALSCGKVAQKLPGHGEAAQQLSGAREEVQVRRRELLELRLHLAHSEGARKRHKKLERFLGLLHLLFDRHRAKSTHVVQPIC
mmetsp:Transcript_13030/g.29744  ORF Transcript_13030/g.29744 Transcript_13030/m.29744 type:complete len:215 (+) Transcript_13030:463-1107(+)